MEKGKKYRVFYNDGERVRDKILLFKGLFGGFAIFFNDFTGLEETLNSNNIIRIEEVKN